MSEVLNPQEIQQFISKGYVRIDQAFSRELANAAVDILWNDLPVQRDEPATWTEPVFRLGMYSQQPFRDSLNTLNLHGAYDQLAGRDSWKSPGAVGTFPVRFPSAQQPNDTGKHVDAGFPGDSPTNYFEWRVNIHSKGRALLMLALYSDISINDAPTVMYEGSHIDVARLLAPAGEKGLSFMEIVDKLNALPERNKVYATGDAGTVYLCHPFLVHAAQAHQGLSPKFMAQPPLLLRGDLNRESEVATAIRQAISQT